MRAAVAVLILLTGLLALIWKADRTRAGVGCPRRTDVSISASRCRPFPHRLFRRIARDRSGRGSGGRTSAGGVGPALAESRRLFEAAREPKQMVVIEGADHNDHALYAGSELIAAILRFLERLR